VITRSKLALLVVAAGWVLVSLLPWWQRRVAFSDQWGTETRILSADAWRASTPAALALLIAAVVSMVLTATRGHPPQTPEQRGTGLFIAYVPVVLLGWVAWSIGRLTMAPHEYVTTLTGTPVTADVVVPDYRVVRDRLEILTFPGYGEGPAWGLYVDVALVLAVTAWATVRLLRSPKPPGLAAHLEWWLDGRLTVKPTTHGKRPTAEADALNGMGG
jgi:hypothetical protein